MGEWTAAKLKDVSRVVTGKTPSIKNPEDFGFEVPFVTPTDYRSYGKWASRAERNLSKLGISRLNGKLLPERSILVTCIGSDMGKVVMNRLPVITNQQINALIPNPIIVDPDFVYYLLKHNYPLLRSYGESGTAVPILNKSDFEELEFQFPSLREQRMIAEVLSTLDDKIDLLHRQNKTLESLAETLFRQWFIEATDESWEEVDLGYVTSRITDGAHGSPSTVENGLPMASVKDMYQWGIHTKSCRTISKADFDELVRNDCRPLKNDIVIAKDGSYLKHVFVARDDLDLVILSSIAILRPNGKYNPLLLAVFLKLPSTRIALESIVTGAVIPRIVLKDFRAFPLLLPSIGSQNKALEKIEPIYRKCWSNCDQIESLTRMRDSLLPNLMSGQVAVS